MLRIGIIQFPGTNCEYETKRVVDEVGMEGYVIRWNSGEDLDKYDGLIIPGGFSYEDRGRAGVIASVDPLMERVKEIAFEGKPVLGICNGAQILVESGLVPDVYGENRLEMALAKNRMGSGTGYYNTWVHVRSSANLGRTAFTYGIEEGEVMPIVIAHAEGRFTTKDSHVKKELLKQNLVIFRYCDEEGNVKEEFPVNPNGSIFNAAGISNPKGNVLALMPHPERSAFEYHGRSYTGKHELKGSEIFRSIAEYFKRGGVEGIEVEYKLPLPDSKEVKKEKKPVRKGIEFFTELIITDNEAWSVGEALKRKGYKFGGVRKNEYWNILADCSKGTVESIIRSGEIVNTNKANVVVRLPDGELMKYDTDRMKLVPYRGEIIKDYELPLLVMEDEDTIAEGVMKSLRDSHNLPVEHVERGILWLFEDPEDRESLKKSRILSNPHYQEMIEFDF